MTIVDLSPAFYWAIWHLFIAIWRYLGGIRSVILAIVILIIGRIP